MNKEQESESESTLALQSLAPCPDWQDHTPSTAFRHLPPSTARFSYSTEGAFFISVQLSTDAVSAPRKIWVLIKLQALVYDILPSTTAVFSYAIRSKKLSANEQFFVGARTVVSLLQITQIKQGLSFIAANKAYTSTNKNIIVWIETELFFFTRGGCVSLLRACLGARLLLQS